eukprot:6208165-Pleurochrysis_carterae.AAC.2
MPLTTEACIEVMKQGGISVGDAVATHVCGHMVSLAAEEESFASFSSIGDWINLGCSLFCMFLAAMAAGLTMGTVSLDETDLRVKLRSDEDRDKEAAARVLPLVQHQPRRAMHRSGYSAAD